MPRVYELHRREFCAMGMALAVGICTTAFAQANDEEKRRLERESDQRREIRKERREKASDLERLHDAERRAREDIRREEWQRDREELRRQR